MQVEESMMDTMSAWPTHGKRKEPDDYVADLLSTFNLSPPKKPRTAADVHPNVEPVAVLPTAVPTTLVAPVTVPAPVPLPAPVPVSAAAAAEERALVLYKPVNPPLFPGGPPAGSAELPYQFNASFLKAQAPGFSHAFGPIPRRPRDFSPTLSPSKSRIDDEETLEDRETMEKRQSLAVIPWVPSFAFSFAAGQMPQPTVDVDIVEADGADPMEISVEDFSPSLQSQLL